MKRWLIRSVQIAALAMGGLALTGTAAQADTGPNIGLFNGNQSSTTIQTPVNICGNSLAIIGFASANCSGGAYASNGSGGAMSGAGYFGGSNGNGNANALGVHHKKHKKHKKNNNANANSYGDNNGSDNGSNGGGAYAYDDNGGGMNSGPNIGIGNGNQTSFTYQAPFNYSCNSVALIGFASSC
jgi:hypothetical protein